MAQIREFESTTESYFILDGVSYPKVYEAMLDNGYSDTKIKLVGTNRDTTPLVFSTEYTNILVDGEDFDTASEAISRLNQVVFSKGGGSGGGGTDYIPLAGTEEGKPVTGPIEIVDDFINLVNGLVNLDRDRNVIAGVGVLANIPRLYRKTEDGYDLVDLNSNGFTSNNYHGENYIENSYTQKKYVDQQHSYSTEEIKTGGTWIDDKDIYTITQPTVDTPPTVDTMIKSTVVGGTYTEYEYTKP